MSGSSPLANSAPAGLSDAHRRALALILRRLAGHDAVWALTGSSAFALQGLPIQAHDIDLQTDAAGAYHCERLLAEFTVRPVAFRQAESIRSHFGSLKIEGVDVEIMGGIEKRGEDGAWSAAADLPPLIRWVKSGDLRLPVLPLGYEAGAYRAMGRGERAALIERWIADHPEDE